MAIEQACLSADKTIPLYCSKRKKRSAELNILFGWEKKSTQKKKKIDCKIISIYYHLYYISVLATGICSTNVGGK